MKNKMKQAQINEVHSSLMAELEQRHGGEKKYTICDTSRNSLDLLREILSSKVRKWCEMRLHHEMNITHLPINIGHLKLLNVYKSTQWK